VNFLRALLGRQEWVYLLVLLIPFVAYNLALKALDIASLPGDHVLTQTLNLMQPALFFNLGYASFWIGLFAAMRGERGLLRRTLLVLLHVTTMLVTLVTTCAHQYFQETGAMLELGTTAEWSPKFDEIKPILLHDVSLSAWMLLLAALLYTALGPWLLTRAIGRWRWPEGRSPTASSEISFLGPLGLLLLALGLCSLSLLVGGSDPPTKHPAAHAKLTQKRQTQRRNVVLIHLESTRAQSVTPYNEDPKTTPFLDELAKSSLLAERAYVVLPRSSKGSVAVNCGIEPPLYPGPEFEPGGIPAPCLAGLLKEQGFNTVFFQSATSSGFGDLVDNFGYEEFYPPGTMDTEGFKGTNTFGYEEDIMLKPSEQWLKEHKDKPFMAEYFTGTGHYGYECLDTPYGTEDFAEDDELNRYLNCLRLQDIFLKNLFDQYKELGLYEDTIFVLFGDHGEGFKEHGRDMHGDTIWEEGLKIPLIIHAPGWFEDGERVEGLSSQIDVLPTVVEMLGYKVKNGKYPGYSLLHELPEDRKLRFSCISNHECLASTKGTEKYIYHYGKRPDEFFDLSKDPFEKQNLISERSKDEIDKRREDLILWSTKVNAQYGRILMNGTLYSEE
jgi:lipoteichoic acid synthase